MSQWKTRKQMDEARKAMETYQADGDLSALIDKFAEISKEDDKAAKPPVNAGDGYRLLAPNEWLRWDDEYLSGGRWIQTSRSGMQVSAGGHSYQYRRKIEPPASRATVQTAPPTNGKSAIERFHKDRDAMALVGSVAMIEKERDAAVAEAAALFRNPDISVCPEGHRFRTIASHPAKSEGEWECPNCAVAERNALRIRLNKALIALQEDPALATNKSTP